MENFSDNDLECTVEKITSSIRSSSSGFAEDCRLASERACTKVAKEVSDGLKLVEDKIKELAERKRVLDETDKQMESNAKKVKQVVKLRVGGKKFETSRSTLISAKGSYFHGMLASGKFEPDDQGYYFIDRDPFCFPIILHFLRDGVLDTDDLTPSQMKALQRDLDYYGIQVGAETETGAAHSNSSFSWNPLRLGVNVKCDALKISVSNNNKSSTLWNQAQTLEPLGVGAHVVFLIEEMCPNDVNSWGIIVGVAPITVQLDGKQPNPFAIVGYNGVEGFGYAGYGSTSKTNYSTTTSPNRPLSHFTKGDKIKIIHDTFGSISIYKNEERVNAPDDYRVLPSQIVYL